MIKPSSTHVLICLYSGNQVHVSGNSETPLLQPLEGHTCRDITTVHVQTSYFRFLGK